jgi:hypothetical protein
LVKVEKPSKVALSIIAFSFVIIVIMIGFGSIDFFEGMSCEELEMFMSKELTEGKYPFQTPFTPTQINDLKEQYEYQCTVTLVDL